MRVVCAGRLDGWRNAAFRFLEIEPLAAGRVRRTRDPVDVVEMLRSLEYADTGGRWSGLLEEVSDSVRHEALTIAYRDRQDQAIAADARARGCATQIGRASCRERVCQYV